MPHLALSLSLPPYVYRELHPSGIRNVADRRCIINLSPSGCYTGIEIEYRVTPELHRRERERAFRTLLFFWTNFGSRHLRERGEQKHVAPLEERVSYVCRRERVIDTGFLCQVFRRLFVRKRDLSRYDTTHNAAANVDSAGIEKGKGLFNRVTGGFRYSVYTHRKKWHTQQRERNIFPFSP